MCPFYLDKVWVQVFVRVCLCACCTPSPKITSIISSFTYCKNLLDEVICGNHKIFFEISVFSKILVAKVVLPWLPHTRPLKASGIPILGVKSGKEITRASAGLTNEEPWKSMKIHLKFLYFCKKLKPRKKIIANIRKLGCIWKRIIPGKQIFGQ